MNPKSSSTDIDDSQPHMTLLDRAEDLSPAGAAFSQISGVLGGFCATIVVLALGPDTIVGEIARDWIVALLLLAAGIYITSAGVLANAISFKAREVRQATYNSGIFLFHLGNLFLCVGILVLTFQFPMIVARLVGVVISILAFIVATINMLPLFRST